MKMRPFGAVLVAAASLVLVASPARADYVVKDGNGAFQTMKSFLSGLIHHPGHVVEGLFSGTPTAVNQTNTGALDVTCVAGCPGAGNTLGTQGTVTSADIATSSTAGQGGVSAISGSPTAASFVTYALNGASGGTLTISGTFVATSQIEASYDNGATFRASSALLRGTNLLTPSITGPGAFSLDLNGVTQLRVRATAYTSGTQTVNFTSSPAAGMTKILNGIKQVDSGGGDATDTVNHAVKVNVVAGATGGGAVTNAGTFAVQNTASLVAGSADIGTVHLGTGAAAIGSITNSAFGISGTLPAFASTPTFNCGTNCFASLAQGSTTSGQTGGLVMGAVTTAAPTYTTAQTSPVSLDVHGSTRVVNVDSTGAVIDPNAALPAGTNLLGSVNLGTLNGAALDASVLETHGTKAAGTAATKSDLVGLVFNTSLPTLTTGQQAALQGDSSGRLLNSDTQAQTKLDTLHTDMGLPIPAGTAIIGKVTTDQTTHGTTDLVASDITKVAGTAIVNGGLAGSLSVGGTAAANAAPTANPVLTSCLFKTTTTAATTGQQQSVGCGDGFGNLGKSFTPAMAVQLTAQSATTANTANTATLGGVASKFTYISGFACTSGGATAASLITVTVAGLITGSMTYTMAIPAGATLAASPLIVSFPNPIQASAVNTAITTQIGAAGSGNTVEQCNAQGFQQ